MKTLIGFLGFYFTMVAILYFFQEHLIFFPDGRTCQELKNTDFEGENLRYIERIHPNASATLIHFHGNAGGVCDRKFVIDNLGDLPINIILVEYPGYSDNGPIPTLKKIKENSLKLLRFFKNKGGPIFLYGESLGSAIATYLASNEKVDGLILQSPFPSLGDVGQSAYPIFPVKWLIKDDIKTNKIPIKAIIFIAENDEIIPPALSKKQIKIFEDVNIFKFENRNHNDLVNSNQKLWREVADFIGAK